jgi:undecaprenyl-diphosphatase
MTLFQAIVLGFLQGVGEFLPISSSAHLILFPWFAHWEDPGLAFDVVLHLGTLVAVLIYFFQDLVQIVRAGLESVIERKIGFDRNRLLFWLLVFGTIPGGISGVLFNHAAESSLRAPLLIAISLSFVGFLMYWIDGKYPSLRGSDDLSFKDAWWIGIAQAFAVIPGVSRSGATITMGRLLSLNRESAARFSFLLSVPIILAAGIFEGRKLLEAGHIDLAPSYLVGGFLSSMVCGLIAIAVLMRYVRTADLGIFAWYRVILAAAVVIWSLVAGR